MQDFFNYEKEKNLINACHIGNLENVKALINQKGINLNYADEQGNTAITVSSLKGHKEIVDLLLEKNITDHSKNMSLILACQIGRSDIADALLNYGANVNTYLEDYHTPLFQAIAQNHMDTFIRLLETKTIDVDLEDNQGVIPLLLAACNGRLEMCQQLIEAGADIFITNKDGWSAKSMAEGNGKHDVCDYLEKLEEQANLSSNSMT